MWLWFTLLSSRLLYRLWLDKMKHFLILIIFTLPLFADERDYFKEPDKKSISKKEKELKAEAPPIVRPQVKVVGTIIGEGKALAVVEMNKNIIYLKVGSKIHHGTVTWTVSSISTDGLTLMSNKQRLLVSYQ